MAKVKKYKKLTNREKKLNKEIKDEMRAKGFLSPVKARLNRKKFLLETKKEYDENIVTFSDLHYLLEAVSWMTPSEIKRKITEEDVGVIKVMKIAVEIKKFKEQKKENGDETYTFGDLFEVINPIKEM